MAEEPTQRNEEPSTELVKVEVPRPALINVELGVGEFIGRVLGRPLEQAGGVLADLLGMVRFELSIPYLKRAQRLLRDAGLEQVPLQPVSLARLLPILEWGSTEPEEPLQDRWASLLANVLHQPDDVARAFPDILRQLDSLDARMLDALHDATARWARGADEWAASWATHHFEAPLGLPAGTVGLARLENLVRLGLCFFTQQRGLRGQDARDRVLLTEFGIAFVNACRPPQAL